MPLKSMEHQSIPSLRRPLPAWMRLMRLEKPIGTWLLFWPCVWGILFALSQKPQISVYTGVWFGFLMALGAVIMRGAGCTLNDIFDRHIDGQVERTKTRPLPAGDITVKGAMALLAFLGAMGLLILIQFPISSIILGTLTVPLIVLYPLTKRFFMLPQLVLGIVFNTGILIGASSVSFDVVADYALWLIYTAGIFWTLGYDTIYALQDRSDDEKMGVYSSARTFGKNAPLLIGLCFGLSSGLLLAVGWMKHWSPLYFLGVGVVMSHFAYQSVMTHKAFLKEAEPNQIVTQDTSIYGQLFKSNAVAGGLIAICFLIALKLSAPIV